MEEDVLNWMPANVKAKILEYCQSTANNTNNNKERFFQIVKIVDDQILTNFKKKQYLGYNIFPAQSIWMLHPTLSMHVRFEISKQELFDRFKSVVQRHIKQPSPNIQKIYSYTGQKTNKSHILSFSCEFYKFTLGDVIRAISEKTVEKISLQLAKYMLSFLFQAYRSILDLLSDSSNDDICFNFSFSLQNILFNRFYSIMLGDSFCGNSQESSLLLTDTNSTRRSMKTILRKQIKQILYILHKNCRDLFPYQNKNVFALIYSPDQSVDVSVELKSVEEILSTSLMEFPNEEIVRQLKTAEKIIQKFSKLTEFHLQQDQRTKCHLKYLAEHGSYQTNSSS